MQRGDLFVEMLGQDVDVIAVALRLGPQLDLRQRLIGEAGRHDEAGVAGGIAEIDQPALRQDDQFLAVGEFYLIDLRLDLGPFHVRQRADLDFAVEVADVTDDRHILHRPHVIDGDNVHVAGGGDEDVGTGRRLLHRHDLKAFHRGLQRADRVNLGHQHARAAVA